MRKRKKALTKEELYQERICNKNHNEIRFVDSNFFRTKNPLQEIREVCSAFNSIVERETGSTEYSVLLKFGITKTAADFEYQYKMFQRYVRNNGVPYKDIIEELKQINAYALKGCIYWKNAMGQFTLPKNIFEILYTKESKLSPTEFSLLMLYKAYSSTPNKQSSECITGLSDTRASEILCCSSKTIQRNRNTLTQNNIINEIYFDGRFRKLRINV